MIWARLSVNQRICEVYWGLWLPRDQPQEVSPLALQPPGQRPLRADAPSAVHSHDNVNTRRAHQELHKCGYLVQFECWIKCLLRICLPRRISKPVNIFSIAAGRCLSCNQQESIFWISKYKPTVAGVMVLSYGHGLARRVRGWTAWLV